MVVCAKLKRTHLHEPILTPTRTVSKKKHLSYHKMPRIRPIYVNNDTLITLVFNYYWLGAGLRRTSLKIFMKTPRIPYVTENTNNSGVPILWVQAQYAWPPEKQINITTTTNQSAHFFCQRRHFHLVFPHPTTIGSIMSMIQKTPPRLPASFLVEESSETPGPSRARINNLQHQVSELVRKNQTLEVREIARHPSDSRTNASSL